MSSSYFRSRVLNEVQNYSQKLGYIISDIEIQDANSPEYCTRPDISKHKDQSIILFSGSDLKDEIEAIDCIDKINIRKLPPSKIILTISYKIPVAIWQNRNIFYFITTQGDVMEIRDNKNISNFILITGSKDLGKIRNLIEFLSDDSELFTKISKAAWIGNRRWDVIFNDGAKLMLPEDSPAKAWSKFKELQLSHEDFKSWKYKTLDFRITKKIYAR